MENDLNGLKEKIKFFFEHKITTHIDTINNSFFNGLIIECSDSLIILNDRVDGETPILISEIKNIQRFQGKNLGVGDDNK